MFFVMRVWRPAVPIVEALATSFGPVFDLYSEEYSVLPDVFWPALAGG